KALYEVKEGFSNYYFNKLERDRILKQFEAVSGKFVDLQGTWTIKGGGTVKGKSARASITIEHKGAKENEVVTSIIDGLADRVDPLDVKGTDNNLKDPPNSGGLLLALYHYRQLLAMGEQGFDKKIIVAAGTEPYYLPAPDK